MSEQAAKPERLRVNEIFHSLQGEADCVGFPTVFVRLTGCPLRCQYCDTEYAFHAGDWLDLDAILEKGRKFQEQLEAVHGGSVSDPVVAGDWFSCSMVIDATMKGRGRVEMKEICVYHVRDGKIASEQFFYDAG